MNKPSEIIRSKLYESGGTVTVYLLNGKPCQIHAEDDGRRFSSNKLSNAKYGYDVFDIIVDYLKDAPGFRAPKGCARNKADKVGHGKCCEGTVIYNFATRYEGKNLGDSTFDPVFVFAAVLEWSGIAHNRRGYIELTAGFMSLY